MSPAVFPGNRDVFFKPAFPWPSLLAASVICLADISLSRSALSFFARRGWLGGEAWAISINTLAIFFTFSFFYGLAALIAMKTVDIRIPQPDAKQLEVNPVELLRTCVCAIGIAMGATLFDETLTLRRGLLSQACLCFAATMILSEVSFVLNMAVVRVQATGEIRVVGEIREQQW